MKKEDWIDVRDRMPEPGQFVLAHGPACAGWVGGPNTAVFRWYDGDWWDANMDAEQCHSTLVTHWMPLPGAPS